MEEVEIWRTAGEGGGCVVVRQWLLAASAGCAALVCAGHTLSLGEQLRP